MDAVAAHVAERLHRALEQAAVLGLATGRTMEPVYAALLSRILALVPAEREPLLARWRSFNLDEDVGLAAGLDVLVTALADRLVHPEGFGASGWVEGHIQRWLRLPPQPVK